MGVCPYVPLSLVFVLGMLVPLSVQLLALDDDPAIIVTTFLGASGRVLGFIQLYT